MGRGQGIRPVLQLAPLVVPAAPPTNVLSLVFTEGGALVVSWDVQKATLQILDSTQTVLDSLSMLRTSMSSWLLSLEEIAVVPGNRFSFAHFDFAWEVGLNGIRLYTRASPQVRTCAGTLASWEDLRTFLTAARTNNLF